MTQRMSQDVQVHLQPGGVLNYLQPIQQREDAVIVNLKACKDAVIDAAELYAEQNDKEKLEKLRDQLLHLVDLEHKAQAHKAAVAQVGQHYRPSLEKSDFRGLIEQYVHAAPAGGRPEADPCVKEFDEAAGLNATADEEPGEDEDLAIVGGAVERNERCPITMKLLIDLKEPVEDEKGFVYESEAIKHTIRAQGGFIECPVAGASHIIRIDSLKPCRRVIRMQKQRQRQGTHGGQTQQKPHGQVLDI